MSSAESESAKSHLCKILEHIKNISRSTAVGGTLRSVDGPDSICDDPVENIMRQRERERQAEINSVAQSSQEFREILDTFANEPRVDKKTDLLKYWELKKYENHILYGSSLK